jgi:DNA repair ATPase RecN
MQCTTAEPPQSPLADECDVLTAEFDHALHHEKLLQAVEDDHADFADLAVASRQLVRLESYNEDYPTLPARYAELVQRVTDTCIVLEYAKDYDLLTFLGIKLNKLKALDVAALPTHRYARKHGTSVAFASPTTIEEVLSECDVLVHQAACARSVRQTLLTRNELQDRLYGLKVSHPPNFESIGRTSKALQTITAEVAQLPLSEEGFMTLLNRGDALMEKAPALCKQLVERRHYATLAELAGKLVNLTALLDA